MTDNNHYDAAMEVVIFGAGSLGSLLGGLLAREHDVTLVGRAPHIDAVRESGLRVSGAFDLTVAPDARPDPIDADLAVVAVKSFDTADAARELATRSFDAVLSVQNGMGNERRLAESLDPPVLAGTCTYGARLIDPGLVECTGIGEVALGSRAGGESAAADRVGRAFNEAGIKTTVATDMPRRLWEKLAVNCAINAPTALARVPNGALVDGPAEGTAHAAAREAARVACARDIDLSPSAAVDAVDRVIDATAANTSSMAQDVRAGTRTEIDAINGYVVERADQPVPVNRTLTALVRAWETERDVR